MPRITVTDLGGSLNQGRAPSELDPNEYSLLRNFYQFGSKLRRRGGMRRKTAAGLTAFPEQINGMASYKPETLPPGGTDMIVAGPTRWGNFVGSTISLIPNQTGFTIPTSPRRWAMFQYKNILYGLRTGIGLVRSDGTYVGPAGIAAPTAAAVLADGGVGAIPAASFKGVYTFYNANTGMESNPSPVSNTLALGANRKIDWTGIGVSSNTQVTSRRIYRTLPDQSGEYFLVAEIANNTQTNYGGDNTLAQDLDRAVSQTNGVPPNLLRFGTVWKERLFASDSKDLFHSQDGLLEAFDPDAVIPVFPDDGHEMRAIHAFGDRLIIGKTNKIHYLVGSDPDTFALLTLSDRHGCVSHHSMQSAEGHLFWLGFDNVYRSDGNNVIGIASVKLRDTIANLSAERASNAIATVFPELGWYVLIIPEDGGEGVNLIYNYRTDVWATITPASFIKTIGDHFDTNLAQDIYVSDSSGHLYHFHDTTYGIDDTPTSFSFLNAEFRTRAWGSDAGTAAIVERALLLCPRYPELITLNIESDDINDPIEVPIKTREVSLDYEPRWKVYSLSTAHQAKSLLQLHVSYSGLTNIEIEGYALDITPLGRQTMLAA